ncbi:MAG: hypothetical protein ACXVW8_13970 [Nocardioidaceae bacterium]
MRRTLAALLAAATTAAVLVAAPVPPQATAAATPKPLTNLAHLDFLGDHVTPPNQAGHTTYQLGAQPSIGTLWTYADHQSDGSFRRVGGGAYDPASHTYGQGAFNADDMARAAVVYLRDWQQNRRGSSRQAAFQLLRGLTYLQTADGPDAGNVVLWMQPDGTLHPSADPKDSPDPSDSDASYWLARTIWALGEGYADFKGQDPAFAGFLKQRLDLAVAALHREVLDKYGSYLNIDGTRTPAWLVVDGADASSEAVLGLAAYVRAGGTPQARTALRELGDGIAQLSGGDAQQWPYGAVRPWALSLGNWHAWAAQMPAALAAASQVLHDGSLAQVAATDSFTFDPWLLTSGGPDNGRLPTRVDGSQIAYGVDARVRSLLATGDATGSGAADTLAGMTAAWFFGANASGAPTYDPTTGVTDDGVAPDGTVNRNSGAESTIHGLLTMLALDAHPQVARIARTAAIEQRVGTTTLQAEDATLSGDAQPVAPSSTWTGESQYGGTGYASLGDGGSATFTRSDGPAARVVPVVDLRPGSTAVTSFGGLGAVRSGDIGAQGDSPAPGALLPRTLDGSVPAGAATLTATTTATGGDHALLDAVMLEPLVSSLVLGGDGHGTAVLRSAATTAQTRSVSVPGSGDALVSVYDGQGRPVSSHRDAKGTVQVTVPAGGFAVVRR